MSFADFDFNKLQVLTEPQNAAILIAICLFSLLLTLSLRRYFCTPISTTNFYMRDLLMWMVERNPHCIFDLKDGKDGFIEHDLNHIGSHIRTIVQSTSPHLLKKYGSEEMEKRRVASREIVLRFLSIVLPADVSIELTLSALCSDATWPEAIIAGQQKTQQQQLQEFKKNGPGSQEMVKIQPFEQYIESDLHKTYYIDYNKYMTKIPPYLHEPMRTEFNSTHMCCLCKEGYRANWDNNAFGKTVLHRTVTSFRLVDGQYRAFSLCNIHSRTWGPLMLTEKHGNEELKGYYVS